MEFRIADTFTQALARLASQDQKAAKTTAFDLQMDPTAPGLRFHRVERSRDSHFWSVRANADVRIIVHKTQASFLLAYVDHDRVPGRGVAAGRTVAIAVVLGRVGLRAQL